MLFAGGLLIYFGLPDGGRIAQATLQRRQRVQGAHALYIEGLSIRSESVAKMRGRRPCVPEPQLTKPGQAYAKDQGSAEDDNRRFDGNPDE